MQNVKLTDLIDPEILQQVQDSLSNYIGMASLIADKNGTPVTTGSNFTEFCHSLTRQSALGCTRCEECDKQERSIRSGTAGRQYITVMPVWWIMLRPLCWMTFLSAASLADRSDQSLEEERFRKTARELSIDEDTYVAAARKVPYRELAEVERAATFLSEIASALSSMAYKNYLALENSRKLERAALSQTAFIIDMNANIQQDMTHWIESAKEAVYNQDYDSMFHTLDDITIRERNFFPP